MNIAPIILEKYPGLNDAQRSVIEQTEGPLLVIAGPGSGKTFSLVLRTLNLLLLDKAPPKELLVCTFTEKAAFELRDRISVAAQKVGYRGDLSELRATTIHGLCNRLITIHRHRTPLGSNYETLDELTQLLFIFDHFQDIAGPLVNDRYLGRWATRWTAIEGMCGYFNKITEELVDPRLLVESADVFLQSLGQAYDAYRRALFRNNRLDFAHQQKLLYDLLQNADISDMVTRNIRYVMVDEYQDTNYIQEQLLLKLSSETGNICVVGDEDQSLYRFRGATVRNILEFPQRVSNCRTVKLSTNYRSHRRIIEAYDRWMASADWSNSGGASFRYDKTIAPDPGGRHPDYPAILSIWGRDAKDEAARVADLVAFLSKEKVIDDVSQVALLLHSVREDQSGPYVRALDNKGIKAFCPRARTYFDNEEVRLMVACFALIFGYYKEGRGVISGQSLRSLADYVDNCIVGLARHCVSAPQLAVAIREYAGEIQSLKKGKALDMRSADYFYQLIAFQPFVDFLRNENRARNLAIFSQLLNVFQSYYHYGVVTFSNREYLRFHLFNSFIRLLYEGGINEYEDPDQPIPKGYVQIMTIHQAKGLEFPVVIVGSLDKQLSTAKQIDRDLAIFYHRSPFEPESRITLFDRMRLHYVAFSRAEKLLVLTSHKLPKAHFSPIWQGLPQWPYVQRDLLAAQSFVLKERVPLKRVFSFTGDLRVYETCPRQYQFFREYDFTPSRSAVIFFGLLVHQTIEELHRIVLDGCIHTLTGTRIRELFERAFFFLTLSDVRAIGETAKQAAFAHVLNYFHQNKDDMKRVIETEVDVSVEKDGYILMGKVDLLMGGDGKLELLDFKTSPRPRESGELILRHEEQLCTYAHIIEQRYGKAPERLLLYWTSEEKKKDALMEFPYKPDMVEEAGRRFDNVVAKITARDFTVTARPDAAICKECDIRAYCWSQGG